ncbi:MAG: metal ABC transporter substrate-binding protein, partial [Actinomycetota bacterium]|nr:metal ABC transporter substrate-binding protein [Actinomycetota bacterium]
MKNVSLPKSFRRPGMLVAISLSATLLVACSGADAGTGNGPRVVASFYPLEYVAERVAGDHADVVNLTSPGVEPHDLELSVAQTAEIADADVAFYQDGFQPAVDEAMEQTGPSHVVDATQVVTLEPVAAHEGETEEEHADHEDEHEGEGGDPHFWL